MDELLAFDTIDGRVYLLPGAIFGFRAVSLTQQSPDGTTRNIPGTVILTPSAQPVVIPEHPEQVIPKIMQAVMAPKRPGLWIPGMDVGVPR